MRTNTSESSDSSSTHNFWGGMAKRKWVSTSSCRLCNAESESTSHVLFDCPALAEVREREGGVLDLETALWGSASDTEAAARLVQCFLRLAQ